MCSSDLFPSHDKGGVAAGIRFLVKHYLYELKPNSGSSMNDRIARLEQRLDDIYKFLMEK